MVSGIKRHVLTCSLGFVLAVLVTMANMRDTQPVAALLALAAQDGWSIERVKVDGIYVGSRVAQAATDYSVDMQVTTPRAGPERLSAAAAALADRGHVRHAEQPLAPPHRKRCCAALLPC